MKFTLLIGMLVLGCTYRTTAKVLTVPIYFITEKDIPSEPSEINYFYVRLCGGDLYNKQVATVFINQPNKPWNPVISDFVKIAVFDASGHQIAVNQDQGKYVDTFNFTYYKTYGDLKLRATTGKATGNVLYTLTVRFPAQQETQENKDVRYYSTDEELESIESFRKAVEIAQAGSTYELVSVFLTNAIGSVKTQDIDILTLNYCFNKEELPGVITVSVLAIDEISGFGTYVCPHNVKECSTEEAPFYDNSGAGVNFVTVNLKQEGDNGPVTVIVRGDGRFGNVNQYKLAASKVFKGKS